MNAPLRTTSTPSFHAHFRPQGDGYALSPAATLVLVADAITSLDTTAEGKARAQMVIDKVFAAARAAKFEQTDILETMLMSGAHVARRLQLCDALVKRVGSNAILSIVRQSLSSADEGGAA